MYNVKLELMYQGTRYQGWQRLGSNQSKATIQGLLEKGLSELLNEDVKLIGSGRTDAGVHAYGQVANFHTTKKVELDWLKKELNLWLPKDIQVLQATFVKDDFHSRYSAVRKCYEYHIVMSEKESVFRRDTTLCVKEKLDIEKMRQGAEYLCGTHDFAGFSSTMHDGRKTVKTLYEVEIIKEQENLTIRYVGDGFLYNMVRIMTGTLLEIGMGKRTPETILAIFNEKNRQKAGWTVDGNGLFLKNVVYK